MSLYRAGFIRMTLVAVSLCVGCSSGGDAATSGNEALSAPGSGAAKSATPAITAADLIGDWGHTSMGEGPDGPVSISFAKDNTYTAKMRSDGRDDGEKGTVTFFANEKDADKEVSFVGDVNALPAGAYVLLRTAIDISTLYRVTLSADKKHLTFEEAARQGGQGLHATGELGPKDTLDKDFNNPPDPGLAADALTGDWGRSGMAEGPDGPVSITFQSGSNYTASVRDGGVDSPQQGSFKVLPTANDAAALVTFVGDVPQLPAGTYLLLQFVEDGSDLYRISLSEDGKELSFESAAHQRGQGLHAMGTLDPAFSLTKNLNE